MTFDFSRYSSEEFKQVFCSVYQQEIVECAGLSFYKSKLPFKRKNISLQPFGFHETRSVDADSWRRICSTADECNVSVKFTSIVEQPNIANKFVSAYNPIIELPEKYEILFNTFSKNMKSNLKKLRNKVEREAISIHNSKCKNDLTEFYYEVFARQYTKKHRMIFQPFRLFEELVLKTDLADLVVAKTSSRVIGGMVLIKGVNTLHYNWGAFLPVKNIPLGTLLVEFTIQHAIASRYLYYDLGSTSVSDQDLLSFKEKFKPIVYPVYTCSNKAGPRSVDLNSDFAFLRKLYSYANPKLLARIMPIVVPLLV